MLRTTVVACKMAYHFQCLKFKHACCGMNRIYTSFSPSLHNYIMKCKLKFLATVHNYIIVSKVFFFFHIRHGEWLADVR